MHELTIASNVLKTVLAVVEEQKAKVAINLKLRIGVFSCISSDALEFGFEVLAKGTAAQGCRLEIEQVPAVAVCSNCEWQGEISSPYELECPQCKSCSLRFLQQGREITLETVTVD